MAANRDRLPRVLIYGAGAIGSLLGGHLSAIGWPVTFFVRPSRAEAIRQHGIRISTQEEEITVRIPVVTHITQLHDAPDLVLLTVKTYAVAAAMPDLERLATDGAAILTFQNGIGTEERLLQSQEITRMAAGSITLAVGSDTPGSIRQETTKGGIVLSSIRGNVELDPLAKGLRAAGLTTLIHPDYRSVKWSKLLLNIMGNAIPAILGMPPERVYADPTLFQIERAAFLEALQVMHASRIELIRLPGFNVPLLSRALRLPPPISRRLIAPRVARSRGRKRPSLWIDVDRGSGITEAAWLNGAVVKAGEQLGIPTPVNTLLTRLVDQVARDPGRRSEFVNRPEALLRLLHNEFVRG